MLSLSKSVREHFHGPIQSQPEQWKIARHPFECNPAVTLRIVGSSRKKDVLSLPLDHQQVSQTRVREAATTGFLEMVDIIAGQLYGLSLAAARKEALVMASTMIGAVTMARVTDFSLSALILLHARKHLTRSS